MTFIGSKALAGGPPQEVQEAIMSEKKKRRGRFRKGGTEILQLLIEN
jgi:hypothetical protein